MNKFRVHITKEQPDYMHLRMSDFIMVQSRDDKLVVVKARYDCYDHGQVLDVKFSTIKDNESVIKNHMLSKIPVLSGTKMSVEITYGF